MHASTIKSVHVPWRFSFVDSEMENSLDPGAPEDFAKEREALQRVSSPYLIKFFGFGTTDEGNGFIVTELLSGSKTRKARLIPI